MNFTRSLCSIFQRVYDTALPFATDDFCFYDGCKDIKYGYTDMIRI